MPDSPHTDVGPRVSIVTPTRNRLRYLKEAVASVRGQTFPDWEMLIVDDASEDQTAEWLASITDPRIGSVRMGEHAHRARARNTGLAAARGEFVIFLDDDDRLRPRSLEVLLGGLLRHDLAVGCGGAVLFDDYGQHRRMPHVRRRQIRPLWPEILGGWVAGTGRVMFQTAALRDIGGWDESLISWQDVELFWRASRRIGPIYMDPYVVREYRRHPDQWIPRDAWQARRRLERSFVASLPQQERDIGEGALRMQLLLEEAREMLHSRNEPERAMRLFLDAYRSAPALSRSPMFRLGFVRGFTQAAVAHVGGPRVNQTLESLRRELLRILHRTPGHAFQFQRRVVDEPTVRDKAGD